MIFPQSQLTLQLKGRDKHLWGVLQCLNDTDNAVWKALLAQLVEVVRKFKP